MKCVDRTPKLYSAIYIEIRSTENVACERVGSEMSKEHHEKLYSLEEMLRPIIGPVCPKFIEYYMKLLGIPIYVPILYRQCYLL